MSSGPGSNQYFNFETQQWIDQPEIIFIQNLSGDFIELAKAINDVISLWKNSYLDTFKIMTQQASIYKSVIELIPANEQEKAMQIQLLEKLAQLEAYLEAYESSEKGPPDWNGKDDLGIV